MPLFEGGFHFYPELFLLSSHKNCQLCLTSAGKESIKNPSCDEKSVEVRSEAGSVKVVSGVIEDRGERGRVTRPSSSRVTPGI